jgi:hypothetical protein
VKVLATAPGAADGLGGRHLSISGMPALAGDQGPVAARCLSGVKLNIASLEIRNRVYLLRAPEQCSPAPLRKPHMRLVAARVLATDKPLGPATIALLSRGPRHACRFPLRTNFRRPCRGEALRLPSWADDRKRSRRGGVANLSTALAHASGAPRSARSARSLAPRPRTGPTYARRLPLCSPAMSRIGFVS